MMIRVRARKASLSIGSYHWVGSMVPARQRIDAWTPSIDGWTRRADGVGGHRWVRAPAIRPAEYSMVLRAGIGRPVRATDQATGSAT